MIEVRKDFTEKLPDIELPLYSESKNNDEYGGTNSTELVQTKVDGIAYPIIKIDDFVIMGQQLASFELRIREVPQMTCSFNDTFGFIKALGNPNPDTLVQVQVLPQFDGAYKKINLQFRIVKCDIDGDFVSLRASYYRPDLYSRVMRAYGKTTTYKAFEQVADELKIGLASNVTDTDDERYIYNANFTPLDFIRHECEFAGKKDSPGEQVYEVWIDFYNCLNLVDVYREYSSDDIKKIWIQESKFIATDTDKEIAPIEFDAVITNHSTMQTMPIYVDDYQTVASPAEFPDMYFEVYGSDTRGINSVYVADSNVKTNIFTDYRYGGEFFGDYDYLSQRLCGQVLSKKIKSERIRVNLPQPIFGLQKGDRVRLDWYETQSLMDKELDKQKEAPTAPESDVQGEEVQQLNKNVSGKYYIDDSTMIYDGTTMTWKHELILVRCVSKT